jgi:hypothetical protein
MTNKELPIIHYTLKEKRPTKSASFQDSFCERYSEMVLNSYKEGNMNNITLHFNSCTLISRLCNNTNSLGKLNEFLTIAGDSLNQVKFTKDVLEERFPDYELIETCK